MKIALFDPYTGKFTGDMERWWLNHGHEVKRSTYYNPELVDWADVIWFDTCDNNLASATKPDTALVDEWVRDQRIGAWDLHEADLRNKKVIVRPIDIEVWQGHHASALWDVVDECIFIAPHIRDMMMLDSRPQASDMKIHTIPCGVDLERWNYSEHQAGKDIAIVAERWVSKGVDYVVQLALQMKNLGYRFHWLGKDNDYHWEREYFLDMIKRHDLPIILYEEHVDDLNNWLDDKNYLLSASKKEAFGYNIAEAMAKGIRPVIHEFYGFEPLWGDSGWTWAKLSDAFDMLTDNRYDSKKYLNYLYDKGYTLDQMMNKIMEVING